MRIFICYRRADARAMTQIIYDHLTSALGPRSVYMDVNVPIGGDHRQHIGAVLPTCTLCLAIIGPNWSAQRPPDRVDYVHAELSTLRARGVPIVPVLVDGATIPDTRGLPPAVAEVMHLEAARINSGREFAVQFQLLLETVRAVHSGRQRVVSFSDDERSPPRARLNGILRLGGAITVLALLIAIGVPVSRAVASWLEPTNVDAKLAPDPLTPLPHPTCTSPWANACASVACSGMIASAEAFDFHLAGIYVDPNQDPCQQRPVRDLWLCRADECLSQRAACENAGSRAGAYTPNSFRVTGDDLQNGFSLSVREGSPSGPVLSTLRPSYQIAMVKRPFLCTGGVFGGARLGPRAAPIEKLTYYLEPR